jgi:hypothetical protein
MDRKKILVAFFVAGLLWAFAAAACAQDRVVAIGDVHGAYPEFVSILQKTGLINADRKWTGGSTTLIQVGDLLDRGARSRECLDLMMGLEIQAKKSGGKAVALLGNHEVLNLTGDLRYVTAGIYRTFASVQSERLRERVYRDYLKFLSSHENHSHTAVKPADETARRKWEDEHPPGFFEHRDAFAPNGKYGAWLRKRPAIVKIGNGLFVHAGLNPARPPGDIDEINDRIRLELAAFDLLWQSLVKKKVIWRYMTFEEAMRHVNEEMNWMQARGKDADSEVMQHMKQMLSLGRWLIISTEGPLWYRGLASEPEEGPLAAALEEMLGRLKAEYLVAGHSVVPSFTIQSRFENRVFLIDTGMLKEAYGGRASALEIFNGQFTAHYADGN